MRIGSFRYGRYRFTVFDDGSLIRHKNITIADDGYTIERLTPDLRSVIAETHEAWMCPEHGGSAAANARLIAAAPDLFDALRVIDVAFRLAERSTPANLRRAIVDARRITARINAHDNEN